VGPVVGVVGAAQADLALSQIDGDAGVAGELVALDGRSGVLRRRRIPARPDCALCGGGARIRRIEANAYAAPACAG
jgi:hypothetical protein